LKGRAGLDLNLGLSYNSLVWTAQGSSIQFNADRNFPAPGFHLGFPLLQPRYYDSSVGVYAYMMVTAAGARVEMRQIGSSVYYQSYDGSYVQLTDLGASGTVVTTTDGAHYTFTPSVNGEYRCTQIKDANGNYISASYDGAGHATSITDTLGRTITFNYDQTSGNLTSITEPGLSNPAAAFAYGTITLQTNFSGVTPVSPFVNGCCASANARDPA
jgi:YD repeat-containing protein